MLLFLKIFQLWHFTWLVLTVFEEGENKLVETYEKIHSWWALLYNRVYFFGIIRERYRGWVWANESPSCITSKTIAGVWSSYKKQANEPRRGQGASSKSVRTRDTRFRQVEREENRVTSRGVSTKWPCSCFLCYEVGWRGCEWRGNDRVRK